MSKSSQKQSKWEDAYLSSEQQRRLCKVLWERRSTSKVGVDRIKEVFLHWLAAETGIRHDVLRFKRTHKAAVLTDTHSVLGVWEEDRTLRVTFRMGEKPSGAQTAWECLNDKALLALPLPGETQAAWAHRNPMARMEAHWWRQLDPDDLSLYDICKILGPVLVRFSDGSYTSLGRGN